LEHAPYPQREYLLSARDAAATARPTPEELSGRSGPAIAELVSRLRLEAVAALRARY
jgi:hypothetical protein